MTKYFVNRNATNKYCAFIMEEIREIQQNHSSAHKLH